MNVVRDIS